MVGAIDTTASTHTGERRIALLIPKPGWSRGHFEDYWLKEHGQLVATTPDYGRYRRDYVQDHVVRDDLGAETFPFAGVASVRLPLGEIPNFGDTSLFRERILPDEEHFLDRTACVALRVREYAISAATAPVKCWALGVFDDAVTGREAAVEALRSLPRSTPKPVGLLFGEVLTPPTDLSGTPQPHPPRVDWVEEARFASVADALIHYRQRKYTDAAPPVWAFISHEHVLFSVGGPHEQSV